MTPVAAIKKRVSLPLEVIAIGEGTPSDDAITLSKPIFVGRGELDYSCGCCGAVLCAGMEMGRFQGLDLKCRACGATNRIPTATQEPGGIDR